MSSFWESENSKRKKLFWFLQFAFWFSNMVLDTIVIPVKFDGRLIFFQFYNFTIAFLVSILLRFIYKKYKVSNLAPLSIISTLLISSIIFGIIWKTLCYSILGAVKGEFIAHIKFFSQIFWPNFFSAIYPFITWSSFYLGFKIYEEYNIQKESAERSASLAQSAQLEMLRYQLNPHFLFNTLSSLRALIRRKDNDIAEEMVTKISEFLKYSLLEGEESKVPLSREIKTINHYFDIEKVRFGNQLIIEYNIDPQTENFLIPVFLIHPLIENAVKHGMKTSPSPLKISLATKLKNKSLWIEITNSGKWIERDPVDDTARTGLQNTQKRLILAYPKDHMIEIVKNEDSVCIRIIIHTNTN
jgi:two-component system, LytTR family, sensor kinase